MSSEFTNAGQPHRGAYRVGEMEGTSGRVMIPRGKLHVLWKVAVQGSAGPWQQGPSTQHLHQ